MTDNPGSSTPPSPFVEGTKVQYAFDATSLGTYMDCPRKYFYSQIRGLRRKKRKATISFGSAFHKGLETYELQKDAGKGAALGAALEAAKIEAGEMEEHRSRTPEALTRSLEAYINHHEREALETIQTAEGKPAVELHFKVSLGRGMIDAMPEQEVLLCGYLDRVVRFQGVPFVLDSKTTGSSISTEKGSKAYFDSFTPDLQMTVYTWAAREAYGFPVRGVIVDAMQVAKTKTEFARNIVHRTPAQIDEWRAGLPYWIGAATTASRIADRAKTLQDQASAFPMNTRACHAKFGMCTFAAICGRDPSVREPFLEADFEVREWNPLLPRQSGTLATEEEPTDVAE